MPTHITWWDIALRLGLTVLVGIIIGFNRSEHGKAAGMRTMLLACLAASVAMIQVNILLPLSGRTQDSFVMNDLMRLPLGILTGVGFIGAGAILRRDNLLVGVTTAAMLWFATVIGLCIGGGQWQLGLAATALTLLSVPVLGRIEHRMRRIERALVKIQFSHGAPQEAQLAEELAQCDVEVVSVRRMAYREGAPCEVELLVRQKRRRKDVELPDVLHRLAQRDGVREVCWQVEA
jgi:putative Mg2+ transporter-C (MgtC) family protein